MRTILIAASLLLSAATAFAAPPKSAMPGGTSHACRPFMERYCEDAKWGQGRRIACLAKHKDQLNAACRERLELMQQVFALAQKNLAASRKAMAEQQATAKKQPASAAKPQPK